MKTTARGIGLIKTFEGLRLEPYLCAGGYWTIGWGHVLDQDHGHEAGGITEEEAERLFSWDLGRTERAVRRLVYVPLTEGQHDALVSFTFNLGAGALQRSTLRALVNREEHGDVPLELRRWVWAGGMKRKGLVRRRTVEGLIYGGQ